MYRIRSIALAALASIAVLFLADVLAVANGGKAKKTRYHAFVQVGDTREQGYTFEVETEPLLFRLVAVKDKYRVMRIRLVNSSAKTLVLSSTADTAQVEFPRGPAVKGILDLSAQDPTLWDSLSADLRKAIAYPTQVKGGEEESIFVFIPVAGTPQAPRFIRLAIASLASPVVLRDVTPVKKK